MLKRILLFDINRILNWDVGRALRADVTGWRIPAILLKGLAGYLVAGLLIAVMIPWAAGRGWQVAPAAVWLLIVGCVAGALASDLIWRKRRAARPRR